MLANRFLLISSCLLALAVGGCNTGEGVSNGSTHGRMRVLNVIPNAGAPINVVFDGKPFVTNLDFEAQTSYQQIDAGLRQVQVSIAGGSTDTVATTLTFIPDTDYTFVAFGPVAAAGGVIINDTTLIVDPGAGKFNVRVINGAYNNLVVDVYVTDPDADLNTVSPALSAVFYGTNTLFANVNSGRTRIRVTPANSKQVIFDSLAQTIAERAQITLVVYSRGSSSLVNVALLNIDDDGTGSISNNLLAQFKIVNASSVPSPLNVFVDQDLALSNVPYANATAYRTVTTGRRNLTVEATATPGATLLSINPLLASATDTSIVLLGPAGAMTAVTYADSNYPPAAGRANVRFVNSSDIPAVDVYANFSKQVDALAMNGASPVLGFDADAASGTNYEIDFHVAGSTQTSLQLPAVTFVGGKLYTIYLVGSGPTLAGVVAQDN